VFTFMSLLFVQDPPLANSPCVPVDDFVACRSKLVFDAVCRQFLALMTQSVDSNSRVCAFVQEAFAIGGFGQGGGLWQRGAFFPGISNILQFSKLYWLVSRS